MLCPRCGGKTKKEVQFSRKCVQCGFIIFNDPKPTAQIIVENEKREILLLKRSEEPWKGAWNTPGGFIEPRETAEIAARRELKEEAGLVVKSLEYLGSYPDRYMYQKISADILVFAFFVRLKNPRVKLNRESSVFLFCPKNKIPFSKLPIPSDRAALRDYLILTKDKNCP